MLTEKDGDNLPEEAAEKRAVVSKDYRRDIKEKCKHYSSELFQSILTFSLDYSQHQEDPQLRYAIYNEVRDWKK